MAKQVQFLFFISAFLVASPNNIIFAQEWPGIADSIYSVALQENRTFHVIMPKGKPPEAQDSLYDVLYVLDGDSYKEKVPAIHDWLVTSEFAPPAIIVLVPVMYVNGIDQRFRDFTPAAVTGQEIPGRDTGGADKLFSFLKDELLPHIESKYPSNGKNLLMGSSLSGLFVTYAFLLEPNLFQSYIASDPSLWWDNYHIHDLAEEKLPGFSEVKSTFWMSGNDDSYEEQGPKKMDSLFKVHDANHTKWKSVSYANETHFSVGYKTFYDGLKFSYFGYNTKFPTYHPMNGILEKDKPITIRVFSVPPNTGFRYTTDGSLPQGHSKKIVLNDNITVNAPAKLKIKSFPNRDEYQQLEEGSFNIGLLMPDKRKLKAGKKPELTYTFFTGDWDVFPGPDTLNPAHKELIGQGFDFNAHEGGSDALHLVEGLFEVSEDGYYVFGTITNGGAKLYVGGQKLIDTDKGDEMEQSFVVPLQKGYYSLRLELLWKEGFSDSDLDFRCFRQINGVDEWWKTEFFILPERAK